MNCNVCSTTSWTNQSHKSSVAYSRSNCTATTYARPPTFRYVRAVETRTQCRSMSRPWGQLGMKYSQSHRQHAPRPCNPNRAQTNPNNPKQPKHAIPNSPNKPKQIRDHANPNNPKQPKQTQTTLELVARVNAEDTRTCSRSCT
jgi:hypothetical protein